MNKIHRYYTDSRNVSGDKDCVFLPLLLLFVCRLNGIAISTRKLFPHLVCSLSELPGFSLSTDDL